jgi:phenylpyruvate tautomerase PptA (4-oxalocrotonate tautomerase family)
MPILNVEIIGEAPADEGAATARRLADAAGEALGGRPGGTWVEVSYVPAARYAESDGGPPDGVRPVFVRTILHTVPEAAELEMRVAHLTEAVARICDRPAQNVHVIIEPAAAGRVAFGGRMAW